MVEGAGAAKEAPGATQQHSVAMVRQALGWTQEELAGRLAVDRRTVARWEAGETTPHEVYVAKMLYLLETEGSTHGIS